VLDHVRIQVSTCIRTCTCACGYNHQRVTMTIAERRPLPQELTMDSLHQPWVYDPNVGVVVASVDEGGDGAFRYERCDDGGVVVVPNPTPTTSDEMQRRFDESLQRVFALVGKGRSRRRQAPSPSPSPWPSPSPSPTASTVSEASPPMKPRRTVRRKGANDRDAFMSRCTIHRVARADKSRSDMTVITPDGAKFRSIATAVQHMSAAGL